MNAYYSSENEYSPNSSAAVMTLAGGSMVNDMALALFHNASWRAIAHRVWAFFTRRPRQLLDLDQVIEGRAVQGSHSLGTHPVDIHQIRGTEGRTQDFDDQFNPLKERTRDRWRRIAMAFIKGESVPAVELVEVDGVYFVRDGHHRISVAHAMGRAYIDAEVTLLYLQKRIM